MAYAQWVFFIGDDMTQKEEFHSKFKYTQFDHPNLADVWVWIEEQLKEAHSRGFDEGIKWEKLENKDEEI